MADELNLNAYFERIGFAGSIAPNLQTLQALQLAHTGAIAFENLNPLLRLPVNLDLRSLEQKLVRERRGGWCFEHNMLFMHALRALDFEVRPCGARVLWDVPPETITRRSHMMLLVDIGGTQYVLDAGFGGSTPTAPLRLRHGAEQETPHEVFRVMGEEPPYAVELKTGEGQWRVLYRFDLAEHYEIDFEAPNWYLATNPNSTFFRDNLIASRPGKGVRHVLTNAELTTRPVGGPAEKRTLATVGEIKEALLATFGIALPEAQLLDPVLERIIAGGPGPS